MKFKLDTAITKDYLLARNSQETYLTYYLGIPVKKGLFRSPLREDTKPTCAFYKNTRGDIIFKDFNGSFNGNFINVVMYKYGCNYYEALRVIANDFGYIKDPKLVKCEKPIKVSKVVFNDTKEAVIQIEMKDFSSEELDWWKQYGITEKTLKKFRVFSCETVFLNGNIYTKSSKYHPIFGYYRGENSNGDELWRIYFPKHRVNEPKFLSNWKSFMLQGAKQLPKTGDLLVITKSLKDVMCLYELGITAIAPNSENLFLTENQFAKLKKRFKQIVLFYDNDLPGIQNMRKFRKQFGIDCIWIPRKYQAKDISDFYKKYGSERTRELVYEAKERIKRKSNCDLS